MFAVYCVVLVFDNKKKQYFTSNNEIQFFSVLHLFLYVNDLVICLAQLGYGCSLCLILHETTGEYATLYLILHLHFGNSFFLLSRLFCFTSFITDLFLSVQIRFVIAAQIYCFETNFLVWFCFGT